MSWLSRTNCSGYWRPVRRSYSTADSESGVESASVAAAAVEEVSVALAAAAADVLVIVECTVVD